MGQTNSEPTVQTAIAKIKSGPLLSIIISSYNYGWYLNECIDSALNQTYKRIEVIVVDDESADNSQEIIRSYEGRVISLFKKNGGQASSINKGFQLSQGDLICFIDSDDLLFPTAIQKAVDLFHECKIVKVHWPLVIIDEQGLKTGRIMHETDLSEGDLFEVLIQKGPGGYNWTSTSGNVWSREFLDKILPIPELIFRKGPDTYLSTLAPLFGHIGKVGEPQGCYRIHGMNNSFNAPFEERLQYSLERWNYCFDTLNDYCLKLGLDAPRESWEINSWWHQTDNALKEIKLLIPAGDTVILVDDNEWVTGGFIITRKIMPFLEREGQYWGRPADSLTAIHELERMRDNGAKFVIIAWSAFWWLQEYQEWQTYLKIKFPCILENERLIIFDLR